MARTGDSTNIWGKIEVIGATILVIVLLGSNLMSIGNADTARDGKITALEKADIQNDKEHGSMNDSIKELKTAVKGSDQARTQEYRQIMGAITDLKVEMAKKNGNP